MRLSKKIRQQLLDQNEGYETASSYAGKNYRESRHYEISNGELKIRSTGKTSWADSRFDDEFVADDKQTGRFLRINLSALNADGVE